METKQLKQMVKAANDLNLAKSEISDRMKMMNKEMKGFEIEAIRGDTWDQYFTDICALYINMGDTFDQTVIYDVCRKRFLVTSWGDWVERHQKKYGIR